MISSTLTILSGKDFFKLSAISFKDNGLTLVLTKGFLFGVVTKHLDFLPRFPRSSRQKESFLL